MISTNLRKNRGKFYSVASECKASKRSITRIGKQQKSTENLEQEKKKRKLQKSIWNCGGEVREESWKLRRSAMLRNN